MKHLWAAIDLGTNSCMSLVCEENTDGKPKELYEDCQIVRLGEGVEANGKLAESAIIRTLAAVEKHVAALPRDNTTGACTVVATSAVRDAYNRKDFLRRITKITNGQTYLLNGREEALTTFLGATSECQPKQLIVTIDVGGGSTEISAGFHNQCLLAESLNVGCVRCAEKFHLLDAADNEHVQALRRHVNTLAKPVISKIKTLAANKTIQLLASAGTATTFAAFDQQLHAYDRNRVHGYQANASRLSSNIERLTTMTAEQRAELPGITTGRAPVFPAGLIILSEVIQMLDTQKFSVTTRALRYGIILKMHDRKIKPTFTW